MSIDTYFPGTAIVYQGLSTDTKPAIAAIGSKFIEVDTGAVFLFCNNGVGWLQVATIPTSAWTEPAIVL